MAFDPRTDEPSAAPEHASQSAECESDEGVPGRASGDDTDLDDENSERTLSRGSIGASGTRHPSRNQSGVSKTPSSRLRTSPKVVRSQEASSPPGFEDTHATRFEETNGPGAKRTALSEQTISRANASSGTAGELHSMTHDGDRYRSVEVIGKGGWGVVQRAIDTQLQREVAIKRMRSDQDIDCEVADRFLYEARVTSQLQHPGVVPVHELADGSAGETYYVMKLLQGKNLRDFIRTAHGDTPWQRATAKSDPREFLTPMLERFLDVCDAMAYAHTRGIVHRDLKPANVMLGDFGETIVVDWGLAKRVGQSHGEEQRNDVFHDTVPHDTAEQAAIHSLNSAQLGIQGLTGSNASRTTMGSVIGTPAYMSPEQAAGEIDEIGPRSDLYSLGVMLYEILTRHHPFSGGDASAVVHRVRNGDWQSPRTMTSRVPRPLSAVCEKAMSLDASDRYATAVEMAADVRRYIAGERVLADREPWWERAGRWCKRHRGVVGSVLAGVIALLVTSIAFSAVVRQAHLAERQARAETQDALQESLLSLAESRRAADHWLIELSGTLQFYPGMHGMRMEMLHDAKQHYQELIEQLNAPEEAAARLSQQETRTSSSLGEAVWAHSELERVRCLCRLGDLERLLGNKDKACTRYREAWRCLSRIDDTVSVVEVSNDRSLERCNLVIGAMLLQLDPSNDPSIESKCTWLTPHETSRSKAWLNGQWKHVEHQPSDAWSLRVASAVVRFALAEARQGGACNEEADTVSELESSVSALERAEPVAAWLVRSRGSDGDHRLMMTLREDLAQLYCDIDRIDASLETWQRAVADLSEQIQATPDRPDLYQLRAHARLQMADPLSREADVNSSAIAVDLYREAIGDLHTSEGMMDASGFHGLNLAAAHVRLGQLMTPNDEESAVRVVDHGRRATQLLQSTARTQLTDEVLRRLANAKRVYAQSIERYQPGQIHEADHQRETANTTYQLMQDHGILMTADRFAWLDLTMDAMVSATSRKHGEDAKRWVERGERISKVLVLQKLTDAETERLKHWMNQFHAFRMSDD